MEYDALSTRYASKFMTSIFSLSNKYGHWRRLWYELAEHEKRLGLPITEGQLEQMRSNMYNIDLDRSKELEEITHHDVMAQIRLYGEACPNAAPIIHMGATSCYITDNADVMIMQEALVLIREKLQDLIDVMCNKAVVYKDIETVGRTHFQPAQPVTVGKRMAIWAQDFLIDLDNLAYQMYHIKTLGCRGATGTCDSFLKLFDGDEHKVQELEDGILTNIGLQAFSISGQTYTRKQDFYIMEVLSGIAQSAYKMSTDIRLLSGLEEVYEPFEEKQVGSSAMPYKKNPMLCERIGGLARYIICNSQNMAWNASSQWLERTLDDSSNRRIVIPDMFMATDAILNTCYKVISGLRLNEDKIRNHLEIHSPYSSMETILMKAVARGGDRQKLHEKLRVYAMWYTPEEFITSLTKDPNFNLTEEEIKGILNEEKCGLAGKQVVEFVRKVPAYELPRQKT